MSRQTYINDLSNHVDDEVTLAGWVYNLRSSGKLQFLILRDGTGLCQCIVEKANFDEELYEQVKHLGQESSVKVTGTVRAEPRSVGGHELAVTGVEIVCASTDYPITPKDHGVDFLLRHRHLHLRSQRQWCIGKIRHTVIDAIRRFFNDNGFTLIDTPIFTTIVGEGEQTLFEVDYFGSPMHLAQTGQLYLESAAMSYGKVYCFGPTFRAEKSKTRRHLTEFWMVEPEVAWLRFDGLLDLCEEFLSSIVARVLDRCTNDLERLERDVSKLEPTTQRPYPRLDYEEAIAKLQELGSDIQFGEDLGGDDETALTELFDRPLLITRWPADIKAFYMQPDPEDPSRALAVDVLAPEGYGEIIGGSERMSDPDLLLQRIHEHGLPEEAFKWYLELRKFGSVPHSGFGMGVERTVAWICGTDHIRETIPFPRTIKRVYP